MLIEICPGTTEYFMYITTFSPYYNSLRQVGLIPVYTRKLRHKEFKKIDQVLTSVRWYIWLSHKEQ